MADENRTFSPSDVDANRAAQQGLGVGQRELDAQRDPGETLDAATPGDLAQGANPEEDWGEPGDEGAVHSANHSRRGVKTEAERGQGAKTRQANKDQFSRRT